MNRCKVKINKKINKRKKEYGTLLVLPIKHIMNFINGIVQMHTCEYAHEMILL